MRKRPAECLSPESRFYLRPLKNFETSDTWFSNEPHGKNTLCNFGKRMAEQAALGTARKSNHSARKTAIELLLHENVPPTNVMQISGHKNVQSLNSYATMSLEQQQSVSHIISKQTSGPASSSTIMPNNDWSDDDTFESMDIDVLDSDVSSRIASVPLNDISNNIASPRPDAPTANHTLSFLNRATINGNITINIQKH